MVIDGFVDSATRSLAFEAADIAVLSFVAGYRRNSGTFMDAMAHGVPVIVSSESLAADLTERYRVGTTFTAGDAGSLHGALGRVPARIDPAALATIRAEMSISLCIRCIHSRPMTRLRPLLTLTCSAALVALAAAVPAHAAVTDAFEQRGDAIAGVEDWASTGWTVATSADGETIAVSTPWRTAGFGASGEVQILDWDGTAWITRDSITGNAEADLAGWGIDLDADGGRIAVGIPGASSGAGRVAVYDWDGTDWVQVGADIDGLAAADEFGRIVELSADGSTLAVSAPYHDVNGSNDGSTRVFVLSGGAWVQMGAAIDGEHVGDLSGWTMRLADNGTRLAIGATGNDDGGSGAGHVRVFEWASGAWTQLGADLDGALANENFSSDLDLSADGSTLAVGASGDDTSFTNAGATHVYTWSGSAWVKVGSTITEDMASANSGSSVSLDSTGSVLAVGSPYYGANGSMFGRVRLFDLTDGSWVQRSQTLVGADDSGGFGDAMRLNADGDAVIVGAPFENGAGEGAGTATAYALPAPPPPPPTTEPPTLPETGSSPMTLAVLAAAMVGVGLAVRRVRRA